MAERRTFRSAVGWSLVMTGGQQVVTAGISLLLAAILGPKAFGTVAMATVYVLFVDLFQRQGLAPAIIQRKDLDPEHKDTAFWLIVGASLSLTLVSVGLSGWWASVNRLPDLQPVVVALSLLIPIRGLIVVQEALLRREMRFRSLAIRSNLAALFGGIVGIGVLAAGGGLWALVAQQLATATAEVTVLWAVSSWRPRLRFSRTRARELLGFSLGASLSSVGVFVNNLADAMLIGLFFGPIVVGLYRFAMRFVELVVELASRGLHSVTLPELARFQEDRRRFSQRVVAIVRTSALLAVPALGVLAAISDRLIALFGPEWSAAAGPLRVLCLVGAVRAVTMFNGAMLQALGRPHQQAMISWLFGLLSAGALVGAGVLLEDASPSDQVLGMAVSRAVLYGVVILAIQAAMVRHVCGVGLAELARAVAPSAAAALAAVGAAWGLQSAGVLDPLGSAWAFVATAAIAGFAAALVLLLTEPWTRGLLGRAVPSRGSPDDQAVQASNTGTAGPMLTSAPDPLA